MKLYKTFYNTLLITTVIAFTGNVAAQALENRGFEISKEAKLQIRVGAILSRQHG